MGTVEEIFRVEPTIEKRAITSLTQSINALGAVLVLFGLSNLLTLYSLFELSRLLDIYKAQQIEPINWFFYARLWGFLNLITGVLLLVVIYLYSRVSNLMLLPKASLSSLILSFWGVLISYDGFLMWIDPLPPGELLESIQRTPDYVYIMLYLVPTVGYIIMGYSFVNIKSRIVFQSLIKVGGLMILASGILFAIFSDISYILLTLGSFILGVSLIKIKENSITELINQRIQQSKSLQIHSS